MLAEEIERAIENRLISGEENAASVNYMTFRFRTKLLTARLARLFQRV